MPSILSATQVEEFQNNGVLVVPAFYDPVEEVRPIQKGIYDLIGLIIRKYKLIIRQPAFAPETFDAGFQELIGHDRRIGGEIYDAVKQLPAFVRLVAARKNEELLLQVRGAALAGIAGSGYGIRIDNPNEENFRAPWHQEYPAQLRSLDGLVLWSPLVPITSEIGVLYRFAQRRCHPRADSRSGHPWKERGLCITARKRDQSHRVLSTQCPAYTSWRSSIGRFPYTTQIRV